MAAHDLSLLEVLIKHASEICHETGDPESTNRFISGTVEDFIIEAGHRIMSVQLAEWNPEEYGDEAELGGEG